MSQVMLPIRYPIIFRYDDMIVPDDESFLKIWKINALGEATFEAPESVDPDARFHWLIESDGRIRLIDLVGKRREWARPFRFLWCFVKVKYSLQESRTVSVGEIKRLLEGTRLDEDKSLTPALQAYLAGRDEASTFDQSMFEEFMRGPAEQEMFEDG